MNSENSEHCKPVPLDCALGAQELAEEVTVEAIVFANGREAHFWLPEGVKLPHMHKIECRILLRP